MKNTAKKSRKTPVIDPYLPNSGNFGYRVSRYELDVEYKVASNRLSGTATITAATLASLHAFTLDLHDSMKATKVTENSHRPAHFAASCGYDCPIRCRRARRCRSSSATPAHLN